MPRPPSPTLPGSPIRKVPGQTAFLHHLLDFVITRPAPEVLPGGPAPFFLPEGADQRAVLPSPSRFRYERTCLRGLSRQPCSFFLPRRCRPKRSFSVTFSFSLCVNPRQRRLLVALRRFLAGKVPGQVTFLHHLLGFVISRPAQRLPSPSLPRIPIRKVQVKCRLPVTFSFWSRPAVCISLIPKPSHLPLHSFRRSRAFPQFVHSF